MNCLHIIQFPDDGYIAIARHNTYAHTLICTESAQKIRKLFINPRSDFRPTAATYCSEYFTHQHKRHTCIITSYQWHSLGCIAVKVKTRFNTQLIVTSFITHWHQFIIQWNHIDTDIENLIKYNAFRQIILIMGQVNCM